MNLGGGGCSELRSHHCTLAWGDRARLCQKKEKEKDREREREKRRMSMLKNRNQGTHWALGSPPEEEQLGAPGIRSPHFRKQKSSHQRMRSSQRDRRSP